MTTLNLISDLAMYLSLVIVYILITGWMMKRANDGDNKMVSAIIILLATAFVAGNTYFIFRPPNGSRSNIKSGAEENSAEYPIRINIIHTE